MKWIHTEEKLIFNRRQSNLSFFNAKKWHLSSNFKRGYKKMNKKDYPKQKELNK